MAAYSDVINMPKVEYLHSFQHSLALQSQVLIVGRKADEEEEGRNKEEQGRRIKP